MKEEKKQSKPMISINDDLEQLKKLVTKSSNSSSQMFGKYQILGELGRGGMGVVYKAYDTKLKTTIALKIIMCGEKEHIERFFLETATVAKLNHPNIIRFYECGGTPRPYFTMEYIEGITLADLIKNKSIKHEQLVDLMIPLCEALHYVHRNKILHRDIKPSNIMLTKDGVPKIMDFGLAKTSEMTKQLSKSGQMLGTIYYMAPEQVEGRANYQSDIYSLGASIYEALTYRPVYQGELQVNILIQIATSTPIPLRQLNPDISPFLEAICLKCLQRNPQKRYADFKQLATELKNFKSNQPIIARKYSSWNVLAHFVSKHKIICSSIVFIFVILSCSLVVTLNALNYAEEERNKALEATQKTEEEKNKTKTALNKVMKILNYSVKEHKILRRDKEFANLFSQIFEDVENYGEKEDWSFLKGFITSQAGNSYKSIEYYTLQIAKNPQHPHTYSNRGLRYKDLKMYKEAFADYNKAIQLNPQYLQAYFNRGSLYYSLKMYNKAISDYSKAIQINPQYSGAHSNRGSLYHKLGKHKEALADYNKAIELDPKDSLVYNNRGLLYSDLNQHKKALVDYNKAIQLDPENSLAYSSRANFYKGLNRYKEALDDCNKAIQLNPRDPLVYNNRGNVYRSLKKYKEALVDYNKAIQLDSKYSLVYYNRGFCYKNLNEYDRALADYNKSIQLDPRYSLAYFDRGNLYYRLKKYNKALNDYNNVIQLNPNDSEAYGNRGGLYHRLNKYNEALSDYSKAI
ncbi:tetratricopeptide repeat protein [Candidatus Uabimicrobium sp. HlEnr_7]|uniref:tetratricopeptide repeat protein n=1 Tax=Candidatus Uabimicrobium helgolandensis TaxID=3095367 RepID=UPI00355704D2